MEAFVEVEKADGLGVLIEFVQVLQNVCFVQELWITLLNFDERNVLVDRSADERVALVVLLHQHL